MKPTVVNGKHVKAGDELDVKKSVANLLINSNKAISLEKTEVSLSLEISPEQLESIEKELEAKFEKAIAEKDEKIKELKETIDEQDALIAKMEQDIKKLTLKELREKYPAVTVEAE